MANKHPAPISRRNRVSADKLSPEKLAELQSFRDQVEVERPQISARTSRAEEELKHLPISEVVHAGETSRQPNGARLW